jgi:PIN domain nuclease of toxin-antitoxin system
MPVFLDTSALFKRYQVENGTEAVNELIEKGAGNLFISSLTIVEITSNLKRLCAVNANKIIALIVRWGFISYYVASNVPSPSIL